MLFIFLYRNFLRQIIDDPVNSCTDIARFSGTVKNLCVFALPAPYNGSHNLNFCTRFIGHNLIDNLVNCLLTDFPSANRTMRNTYSCVQKAEIIVNFRNRADR